MKIEISKEISSRITEILERTPDLVAALVGQYSQDAFTKKAFDGNPWPPNKDLQRQGSELIRLCCEPSVSRMEFFSCQRPTVLRR